MVAEATQSAEARQARIIRCEFPDVDIPDVTITEWVPSSLASQNQA